MPAENVILTAKWAPVRETTLVYNFNGGFNAAGESSITVDIGIPNGEYPIADQGIHREGYTFVGWTTDKDGEGKLLQTGDLIQVDTINSENNVLYAQWVKVVKVTVTKQVTGKDVYKRQGTEGGVPKPGEGTFPGRIFPPGESG